jgi:hypothetical protein
MSSRESEVKHVSVLAGAWCRIRGHRVSGLWPGDRALCLRCLRYWGPEVPR